MPGQPKVKQQLWKVQIAPECRQFYVGFVVGFYNETVLLQESDDFIGHCEKLFLTHILAVEVQILGETVDSLNDTQIGSTDKSQFTDIRRISQVVKNQQLQILLEHIALETVVPGDGRRKETADESEINHIL